MKIIIDDPYQQLTDQQKQTLAQYAMSPLSQVIERIEANGGGIVFKSRISDQDIIGKILGE